MSFISVFDVMGPNMIGPSSSHTAGAARIGFLAQKMINGPLKEVNFTLYGSFARTFKGHGTDRAGPLGPDYSGRPPRYGQDLVCAEHCNKRCPPAEGADDHFQSGNDL